MRNTLPGIIVSLAIIATLAGCGPRGNLTVQEKRDKFLKFKRATVRETKKRDGAEEELLDVMREHGIERIHLEDENKFIEIEAKPKAKIKTGPKDKSG